MGKINYRRSFYDVYIKRAIDFTCSLLGLIILSPVFIFTVVMVRIKLGSPVIFKQERPGLNEKTFTLYKFRSMTDKKDAEGNLLPDEIRLTNFGKKLRSTSLDELPQLINILKGDMAIIGPRALLKEYLPYYSNEESLRHAVRPGLTNLVSVKGRNAVSVEEKFKYDIYYVKNLSFKLDLYIFFQTVAVVLKHEGVGLEASGKYIDYFNERAEKINR